MSHLNQGGKEQARRCAGCCHWARIRGEATEDRYGRVGACMFLLNQITISGPSEETSYAPVRSESFGCGYWTEYREPVARAAESGI